MFVLEDASPPAYHTRRDWILAEVVIGIVSCATAITGISGGIVADALRATATNMPWFLLFYASGAGMLLVATLETMCRRRPCSCCVIRCYAAARMVLHCVNALCWFSAFVWLTFTATFVASILYESLPLMIFNAWGAIEHAKAIWLNPQQARTTSLAGALFRRLSRG
jgi:hypothetical protein